MLGSITNPKSDKLHMPFRNMLLKRVKAVCICLPYRSWREFNGDPPKHPRVINLVHHKLRQSHPQVSKTLQTKRS